MRLRRGYRSVAWCVVAVAAVAVCIAGASHAGDKGKKKEEKKEKKPPASQFYPRVRKMRKKHEPTDPPEETPDFRWDFSRKLTHRYDYRQLMKSTSDMGGGAGKGMDHTVAVEGDMLVKSQGDGTAKLVLQNLKMKLKMSTGQDKEPQTREMQAPPIVVPKMKEDGSAEFGKNSTQSLLKVLFSLPPEPLEVGESVRAPMKMPFNAAGSPLLVKGHIDLKLARYVQIGGHKCAELRGRFDISKLDVPEEMEGQYNVSLEGAGVYYFAAKDRKFVSAAVATVMKIKADVPAPGAQAGRGMSMKMDAFLTFDHAEPEAKE